MRSLYFCLALFFLTACRTDPAVDARGVEEVQLLCEALAANANDDERFAIYAYLEDSKVKLVEMSSCQTIKRADFKKNGIPEAALSAVGGIGDHPQAYVYAQLEEGNEQAIDFYLTTEHYDSHPGALVQLATYKNGQFQLLRPLHLADLAGYYWCAQKDTSYVLFLGLKGSRLNSKLFATDEPLPAQKVLQRALPAFASSPDLDFDCELNALVFESGLGNGHVFWRPDSAAVVFDDFMHTRQPMTFELISF